MLKVGEVVIPGESDETFHPGRPPVPPGDGQRRPDRRGGRLGCRPGAAGGPKPYYTYRLLILPETIGSVAYLSHHESLIPSMVGGLFLEMLGNKSPPFLAGIL